MVSLVKIIAIVFLCLTTLEIKLAAEPIVANLSKTETGDVSYTIQGFGFGIKPTQTPYIWDNFEKGSNNTSVHGKYPTIPSASRAWIGNYASGCEPVYSNTQNRNNSSLSAKLDLGVNSECTGRMLMQNGIPFKAGDRIYFSVWMRFDWGTAGGNGGRQIKTWRIFKEGIPEFDRTYIYLSNLVENDGATYKSFVASLYDGVTDYNKNLSRPLQNDKWVRFEVELQLGTAPLANDGVVHTWVSLPDFSGPIAKEIDRSNAVTIPANGDIWDSFWLGQWTGTTFGGGVAPCFSTQFYDDVYFDTSWQRIELGDAAEYSACTHREIQIPTSWSSTEISFEINKGSFNNGDLVYLFVVDENGVPSLGRGFIIGSDGSGIPSSLTAPENLEATEIP